MCLSSRDIQISQHQTERICISCHRIISEKDERFSYFASVGVNTYVTVQLSFLPESQRRSTRITARTFLPEFDNHMEVSCDLLVQRSTGETCSLAEQLEEASAVFTVWNKDNRKGLRKRIVPYWDFIEVSLSLVTIFYFVPFVAAVNVSKPKDVMLGTVKVPLADLIHKRTGMLCSNILPDQIDFLTNMQLLFFPFPNLKVFLAGMEYIYLRKQVLLSTSTSLSGV